MREAFERLCETEWSKELKHGLDLPAWAVQLTEAADASAVR